MLCFSLSSFAFALARAPYYYPSSFNLIGSIFNFVSVDGRNALLVAAVLLLLLLLVLVVLCVQLRMAERMYTMKRRATTTTT